jgi:hypothetical protein
MFDVAISPGARRSAFLNDDREEPQQKVNRHARRLRHHPDEDDQGRREYGRQSQGV